MGLCVVFVLCGVVLFPLVMPIHTARTTNPTIPTEQETMASLADTITVSKPKRHSVVTTPLTVEGWARGNWFFEGSAPAIMTDSTGKVLATGTLHALGDWMTTDYVAFRGIFSYALPITKTGTLILRNDNPSGDPDKQKELYIPVVFYR